MVKEPNSDKDVLGALAGLAEAVGLRFDKVDGRLDKMDQHLTDIDHKLERIEAIILRDHQHRIEVLERKAGVNM